MKKTMFVAVLIAGCAAIAFSQARPTLGVLPFTGGAGQDGDVIASLFLNQRELRDVFNVVPRTMALSAIFTERQFQLSDLTDPDTIASLNRMLNADYVLSGNITRLGDRNLLIASIVNVETFQQVAGYHVTYRNIEEIIGLLPSMASGMASTAQRRGAVRPPSLAVIPFAHRAGVSAQDAETLAQILAIEILNTGRYAVLSRLSIIQAALREQGFQMLGYTDDAGMASLGRAMNADMVLGGSITGLGAVNLFMAQILNVEDGRVIEGDSVQYQAIPDGIELMGELAILLAYPPGPQRNRRLTELRVGQGHSITVPGATLTELRVGQEHSLSVPGATLAEQLAWLRANAVSDSNYVIELSGNVAIAPQTLTLPSGRNNVTITLRGIGVMRTVSLSANGNLFRVYSGVTLVLENITLAGRNNNARLVVIASGGTMIMNAGSRVIGNLGGGVSVWSGGMFIMNDGEISGNRGNLHGAGVFVNNGGAFDMRGGRILNNRGLIQAARRQVGSLGGGVRVYPGGSFRMSNGTIYGLNAEAGLRNTAGGGAASLSGTGQRGTFNTAGDFTALGGLGGSNNTIRVVNGALR